MTLQDLHSQEVFRYFYELTKIPHGSHDTKQISDYCVEFAKRNGLKFVQDDYNNVIIQKPGTAGYENAAPVIIQGHLDMVCVKTPDSEHDFTKDALDLYLEDGLLKARGTTLGADDGVAIAYAMAVLASTDLPHPPIEAVFTVDEEVGMLGANHIDLSPLKGSYLLNIDTDVEGVFVAGCAGGYRHEITLPMTRSQADGDLLTIEIRGLQGGHSGSEIDQQRGNANKMMGRLLNRLSIHTEVRIAAMNGGTADNVIAPDAKAQLIAKDGEKVQQLVSEMTALWQAEFGDDEPGLKVTCECTSGTVEAFDAASSKKLIHLLVCAPNGVKELNRKLAGLVETSLNLGVAKSTADAFSILYLVRSSNQAKMDELQEELTALAEEFGAANEVYGYYPSWSYRAESKLREMIIETYQKLYQSEPTVTTIHAGLECGLLSAMKPDLDCVSFGPTVYDIHSVDERMEIDSFFRVWEFIKEFLKNCK